MHSSLFTTHTLSAKTLYRRRQTLLRQFFSRRDTLQSLEKRLAGHISALALTSEPVPDAAPSCAAETFVQFAALLVSDREELLTALNQWSGEDDTLDEAMLYALTFCASPSTWKRLQIEMPSPARLELQIKARSRLGKPLPENELEEALDPSQPVSLQGAALEHIGHCCPQLLNVASARYHDSHAEIQLAALSAGLRLGDHAASEALRSEFEPSTDPSVAEPGLLRLGAIALPNQVMPSLEILAEENPKDGLWLLALTGQRDAAATVLRKLQEPRSADDAAIAWQWLSGQALPRRPRLHLVEAQQPSSDDNLPDPAHALQWWQQQETQWPATQRRAFGIALDENTAHTLADSWSGQAGDALSDIAALCHSHYDVEQGGKQCTN